MPRRRLWLIGLVVGAAGLLAGCGITHRVSEAVNPDLAGFGGRCLGVMRIADPGADLELDQTKVENTSVRALVTHVSAARRDRSAGSAVAADCQFDNGILSSFHWTKGGPAP